MSFLHNEQTRLFTEIANCIIPPTDTLPGGGNIDILTNKECDLNITRKQESHIIEFLDKADIKKSHIIGNSFGAVLGGLIAAYHPTRVDRFISIGGLGTNIFSAFPGEGITLLSAFVEDPSKDRLKQWLDSMVFDKSLIDEQMIESRYEQAIDPVQMETSKKFYAKTSLEAMAENFRGPDATNRIAHLSSIQAPTLLTWGRDDRVTPLDQMLIPMRLIPNCEVLILPKCGHWSMIEQKEAFESSVLAFLRR